MRRTTARDEALPPDVGSPVPAPQGGFPFGPVGGAGPGGTPPWGGPSQASAGSAGSAADPDPFPDAPFPPGAAAAAPAPAALPWASTDVPTDVPPLDDVLDGSADVAGTFRDVGQNVGRSTKKTKRKHGRKDRAARVSEGGTASGGAARDDTVHGDPTGEGGAPDRASRRRAARTGGGGARSLTVRARTVAAVLPRRRATGLFARGVTLWAAGGLALAVGIGVGAGADYLGSDAEASTDAATATVTEVTPEVCAAAQVAWSRAASAQVRMDVESPRSLRTGFVGARDALSMVDPPGAVITDWATVLTYVTAAADATQDVEDDEVEAAVADALAAHDTEEMTAASQRITDYLAADCTS
ncbi:hypothetical protein UQW22_02365 [Isoptericola halotolerans]|uniref:hypothetical protein n=1 Tax=Isoptericola halotolerans TaxID=300560 RepID=UPI00388F3A75